MLNTLIKSFHQSDLKLKETSTKITTISGKTYHETKNQDGEFTRLPETVFVPPPPPPRGTRLECSPAEMHGFRGDYSWTAPKLTLFNETAARPGYATKLSHEYKDEPEVLIAKVQLLAKFIRSNIFQGESNTLLYTGAGISRAAGIAGKIAPNYYMLILSFLNYFIVFCL